MNRHVLKVLCLLASVVIWTQVAANRLIVREADLPVRLEGAPAGYTLDGSEWQQRVKVRAAGSKWQFFRHRVFGADLGEVVVDVSGLDREVLVVHDLTVNDVRSDLQDVTILHSSSVRLYIDRLDSLRVPVLVDVTGDPGDGRMLLAPPRAVPDSVYVRGPSRFLADVGSVSTETVDLARVRGSGDLARNLRVPGEHLGLSRPDVAVVLQVVERGRRVFEHVPLVPLLDSRQPHAEVFPPVASVEISGPAEILAGMSAADVSLTVSSTGLGAGAHTVRPEVLLPDHCVLVNIEPAEYMLVVGGS
jgi:YbbR domain-containing protein